MRLRSKPESFVIVDTANLDFQRKSTNQPACLLWLQAVLTISPENSPEVEKLREMPAASRRAVVFSEAGINTESGIPDFRSPGGIWEKYRPIEFEEFMTSEQARREYWRRKFATHDAVVGAEPNQGVRGEFVLTRRPGVRIGHRNAFPK